MRGLTGFVGQGMNGVKPDPTVSTYSFSSGRTRTWTCPRSGLWRFVLWGGGGGGDSGSGTQGASGSYYEAARLIAYDQRATIFAGGSQQNSTVTLPTGEVLTAGGGISTTPGTATANQPDDIVYNGSAVGVNGLGSGGGTAGLGAGAPGNAPFYGGDGGGSAFASGNSGCVPGGGGRAAISGNNGGAGMVLIVPVTI